MRRDDAAVIGEKPQRRASRPLVPVLALPKR